MFSTNNFSPTYSQPALNSYGTLRQARNNAGADADFAANSRQFKAPAGDRGLSAGSKALQYRTAVTADAAKAQGAAAMNQTYLDQIKNSTDANLAYQTGAAGERAGIRGLGTQQQQQQQAFDLTKEQDAMSQLLANLSRKAQADIGRTNRNSSLTYSLLGNLFGG